MGVKSGDRTSCRREECEELEGFDTWLRVQSREICASVELLLLLLQIACCSACRARERMRLVADLMLRMVRLQAMLQKVRLDVLRSG